MIEYYDKEELELQISNYLSGNSTDEEKETLLAFLASNEAAAPDFPGNVCRMGTFFRTVVCRNRKLQFSADKGENDCSCLFEACPEADACLAESGCRRYSADRLQLFLVYVYGKSDGSIYQRRFSLRNQGSCRIENEYRSS